MPYFLGKLLFQKKYVRGKVHGNQGMKQLGLEIIREGSKRKRKSKAFRVYE
jgi:hypothetical protein